MSHTGVGERIPDALHRYVVHAVVVGETPVNQDRHQNVIQDATCQHKEPLPLRLGSKLPLLRFAGHTGLSLLLVDHALYGAVASERQPADAILCLGPLWLPLPESKLPVKEKVKLGDADAEELRPQEVSQLVDKNQK